MISSVSGNLRLSPQKTSLSDLGTCCKRTKFLAYFICELPRRHFVNDTPLSLLLSLFLEIRYSMQQACMGELGLMVCSHGVVGLTEKN